MLTIDANIWVAAYDPRDRFHEASMAFLRAVSQRELALNGPAFVILETACALARRTNSAAASEAVIANLRAHPRLHLEAVNEALLSLACEIGSRQRLRGADALYVATAALLGSTLISWDNPLIRRADAITPTSWLAKRT
jgi:predicted nucleic acid-binding protein